MKRIVKMKTSLKITCKLTLLTTELGAAATEVDDTTTAGELETELALAVGADTAALSLVDKVTIGKLGLIDTASGTPDGPGEGIDAPLGNNDIEHACTSIT